MAPAQATATSESGRFSIEFGRFRVLPHRREVLADGGQLELGGRAFDVLMALIDASGAVVSKDSLMRRVWPDRVVEENNLQAQISALRRAFGADRDLIRTVPGRGYQFAGQIRVVSISADAQPDKAPAAKPSRPATNLPEPVSELIGRDAELNEILELTASHRLVTLTGAGGIGKTRLGLEAARRLLAKFSDGVWVVELAPLSDPALVPMAVATALGLELASGTASPASVASALHSKQFILVLDNCEHVVDAAARMADSLLRASAVASVIATSREPLRVEGERIYPVPPLAVPVEGNPDGEDPLRYGAIRLFVDRARAAAPSFSPDARVAAAVVEICRRLDGIPLAIELAAARAAALGIEGIGVVLDDRFRFLASGYRTALPRHQTLRATFDWSYELLTEPERAVLGRLAVFAGGFTLQDAGAVAADERLSPAEVVDCVANLVAKSLVTADAGDARLRYRLLETTRAYSLGKLVQSRDFQAVARRHAERYRDLFEAAETESERRPIDEWLADYVPRIDNLRAALDWAFSREGDASIGLALTAAAVPLWMHLSLMEECSNRVERALDAIGAEVRPDARREMKLHAALAASLMYTRGAVPEVEVVGSKALEMAEDLDDTEYQLRSLFGLWSYRINCGPQGAGLILAQRFHALAVKRPEPNDRLTGGRMVGTSQYYLGDLLGARGHLESVLAHGAAPAQKRQIARFEVDQRSAARAYLARIMWLQGLPDQAMRMAESSVAEARATDHAITLGLALARAACPIALLTGDLSAAEHYTQLLLDHSTRHALARWRAFAHSYRGVLLIQRGDLSNGLRLLRAGFDEPGSGGAVPRFVTSVMAGALGRTGRIAEGLVAIEEAIVHANRSEERWAIPELLRVKGRLVLLQNAPGAADAAEEDFRGAIDCAHRLAALSWELRAARSLARLWRDQGRRSQAHDFLVRVYDRFTEGFATADLTAAKALIDALR
jgi:predicted ATPase/DNA-binding winged helix-turn-helix (wHTH) protein